MIRIKEEDVDDAVLTYHEEYTRGTHSRFAACIAAIGGVKSYVVYEWITNVLAWGHRSSRAEESHLHPLTEPCVKVSPHTALHIQRVVHRQTLGV